MHVCKARIYQEVMDLYNFEADMRIGDVQGVVKLGTWNNLDHAYAFFDAVDVPVADFVVSCSEFGFWRLLGRFCRACCCCS